MDDGAAPGFAFPDGVVSREVDGEMVLLNLRSEQYFSLDRVGADMVARLTRQPMDEAVDALGRDYEVEAGVLRDDLDQLVTDLQEAGLLERRRPR
ncbi:MAG: PqqD family protein [Actinomycetes bacterium]